MIYENVIRPFLSEKRYKHCLNVAKSAEKLAKKYGCDPEKAKIAGILHDITKERTVEEQLELIYDFEIEVSEFELHSKKLFHAVTGSAYAKNILKISDPDIINAIRYHTTARKGMSLLERIIFIADSISDDRDFKGVDELRKLADKSLDSAMLEGLAYSIKDLAESNKPIHPNTFEAYNEIAFKKGRSEKIMDALDLSNKICEILKNKKAMDVNTSCIKDVSVLADYFVFATGTSNTHVKSLAEEVEFKVKEMGISSNKKEADNSGTWILLDYGDVIVHIFTDETRKLYNVEKLWDETKKKLD